jgi:hypothetical protein
MSSAPEAVCMEFSGGSGLGAGAMLVAEQSIGETFEI